MPCRRASAKSYARSSTIWTRRNGLPRGKEDRLMNNLFEIGLANALVAALLAAPAYCLSRWGKRPALAHAFWLFILIKPVTPPLWHVPVSLQNLATNRVNPVATASNEQALPVAD